MLEPVARPQYHVDPHVPPPDLLVVKTARDASSFVIALGGEVDIAGERAVREALHDAETSGLPEVIVDLGAVDFVDSMFVQELLRLHRRLDAAGRRLLVLPGPRRVQRVFEVCGLMDVLPFLAEPA